MAEKRKRSTRVARGRSVCGVRKARCDGWTAARREIFLDHYAENGIATEACRAAGMEEGAAYRLCRRDPEFAAQYAEAFAISKLRLEEMAVLYAKTGGKAPVGPGETPSPDLANFDPEFALKILNRTRPSVDGPVRPGGPRPRAASKAELIEAIMKGLAMLKKRRAKARRAPR